MTTEAPEAGPGSSDRGFGLVFCALFAIIALLPLLNGHGVRLWSLVVSALFLLIALTYPRLLAPLNRVWTRFGLLLHRVMTPLVMAILFFVVVTPLAVLMRLSGKDPLALRFDRDAKSYWQPRPQPGPTPETMKFQF